MERCSANDVPSRLTSARARHLRLVNLPRWSARAVCSTAATWPRQHAREARAARDLVAVAPRRYRRCRSGGVARAHRAQKANDAKRRCRRRRRYDSPPRNCSALPFRQRAALLGRARRRRALGASATRARAHAAPLSPSPLTTARDLTRPRRSLIARSTSPLLRRRGAALSSESPTARRMARAPQRRLDRRRLRTCSLRAPSRRTRRSGARRSRSARRAWARARGRRAAGRRRRRRRRRDAPPPRRPPPAPPRRARRGPRRASWEGAAASAAAAAADLPSRRGGLAGEAARRRASAGGRPTARIGRVGTFCARDRALGHSEIERLERAQGAADAARLARSVWSVAAPATTRTAPRPRRARAVGNRRMASDGGEARLASSASTPATNVGERVVAVEAAPSFAGAADAAGAGAVQHADASSSVGSAGSGRGRARARAQGPRRGGGRSVARVGRKAASARRSSRDAAAASRTARSRRASRRASRALGFDVPPRPRARGAIVVAPPSCGAHLHVARVQQSRARAAARVERGARRRAPAPRSDARAGRPQGARDEPRRSSIASIWRASARRVGRRAQPLLARPRGGRGGGRGGARARRGGESAAGAAVDGLERVLRRAARARRGSNPARLASKPIAVSSEIAPSEAMARSTARVPQRRRRPTCPRAGSDGGPRFIAAPSKARILDARRRRGPPCRPAPTAGARQGRHVRDGRARTPGNTSKNLATRSSDTDERGRGGRRARRRRRCVLVARAAISESPRERRQP